MRSVGFVQIILRLYGVCVSIWSSMPKSMPSSGGSCWLGNVCIFAGNVYIGAVFLQDALKSANGGEVPLNIPPLMDGC